MILEYLIDFSWESFYFILLDVVLAFQSFINYMVFFVKPNLLKSLTFSLLVLNLIKYCDSQNQLGRKRFILASYVVYSAIAFFPPEISQITQMQWYEMLIFLPYFLVIILGGILKFSSIGKRFLNYYTMFGYYLIVEIIWLIVFPNDGIWFIVILFALFLFVIANIGGLINEVKPEIESE